MQFNRKLPLLAMLGGAVGAVLRALQLVTSFEWNTGLYIEGSLHGKLLIGWLVLAAAVVALASSMGEHHASFEEVFAGTGTLYKVLVAFSGLLMSACGMLWLVIKLQVSAKPEVAEPWAMGLEIPFGLFCIVAGMSIVGLGAVLSRGSVNSRQALLLLPPVFWAAFHLLVAYRQYCVSANLAVFTPDIFASIACVMAFYHFSRMLYGKPAPRRFAFWAAMTIVLTMTDTLGYALGEVMGGGPVVWTAEAIVRACCLLCACVFLMVELILMTSRVFTARASRLSMPFDASHK